MQENAQDSLKTNPFLINKVDNAPELQTFMEFDLPFSWTDELQAVASEALPQTFNRNIFAMQNAMAKGLDSLDMRTYGDLKLEELGISAPKENVIKTAAELNEQYKTDVFKTDMADWLAPDYLKNIEARKRNEYIMEHDGGTGLGTMLLGSTAGFIEPTNFVTSFGVGHLLKGASTIAKVAGTVAEAGGNAYANAYAAKEAADVEYTTEELAIQTGMGSALGALAHISVKEKVQNIKNPTAQEAVEAGKALDGVKTPEAAVIENAKVSGNEQVRYQVDGTIEHMAPSEARVNPKEIVEAAIPKVHPEALANIKNEVASILDNVRVAKSSPEAAVDPKLAALPDNPILVFNKINDVLDDSTPTTRAGTQYAMDVEDGIKSAFVSGESDLKVKVVSADDVLDLKQIKAKESAIDIPEVQAVIKQLPKDILETATLEDVIASIGDAKTINKVLTAISDLSSGKAILFKNSLVDYSGKVDLAETMTRTLNEKELLLPKKDLSVLKNTVKDTAFGSEADADIGMKFKDLPEIDESPRITEAQARVQEMEAIVQMKRTAGFLEEDMNKVLDTIAEEEQNFMKAQEIEKMFIACPFGD